MHAKITAVISSSTLLALSSLPSAMAADCVAVGYLEGNSINSDPSGPVYGVTQGVQILKDGKQIENWTPCDSCAGVCSDYIGINSDDLDVRFGWASSCGNNKFTECHGSYGSQTHIDGDDPKNDGDFYGLGFSSLSQCAIPFDC